MFQLMEIAHTHYWTKEINETTGLGELSASIMSSRSGSPMGSRENLHSPTAEGSEWSGSSRKSSIQVQEPNRRMSEHEPSNQEQSTTEMFKDMLTQKRNMLMSKLSSFDSDVHGSHVSVASDSMNVPKTGSQLIPSISCRSTVSDTEYENVSGCRRSVEVFVGFIICIPLVSSTGPSIGHGCSCNERQEQVWI